MSKADHLHGQRAGRDRHLFAGGRVSATPSGFPGKFRSIPTRRQLVEGGIEAQMRRVFENLQAIVIAAGASLDDVVKVNDLLDRPAALRARQQDHGRVFPRTLPGPRRGRRRGAAARRANRSGVHRRAVTAPRPVTALRGVGAALAQRLGALGVETIQDLLFLLAAALRGPHPHRAARRTASRPARGGRGRGAADRDRVPRPAPAAVPHRRWLGISDAAVLSFQRPAATRAWRAACESAASARRGAGPSGLEIVHPEYRRVDARGRSARERSSDSRLSRHRGPDAGPPAPADVGMALDELDAAEICRTGCRRRCSPTARCPRSARRCATCTGRPRTRRSRR